ncbi:ABC transporter substrate-binding protein [Dinghuibacter silviterrae]|uniref:Putative ABC transport system substrate-binding protein n=1 Tax=Dinghuibacter silviterrae TaxID=1539049 RepID=A0A4R8DHP8_9BACT|nr:ABC transporter substrate-binding protein [Dinghuibacter silviterrae]TDW96646.1 putative ABC transport system substrate-binding protein [Dinghuibacter silviterrae]
MKSVSFLLALVLFFAACHPADRTIPTVGFADAFVDNTLDQAKQGFFAALSDSGFSEDKKTVHIVYRNAQGSPLTLTQVVKYFVSEKVDLIGTNPSAATVAALQSTRDIPVFMMVSPIPEQMKETDAPNLFGVADTQDYIDTSFALIKDVVKPHGATLTVGMIYNQSEPQSVDALHRIQALAQRLQVTVVALPVNATADVQLVTQSLLSKNIDAFFANPDNTVFGAFETIIQSCNNAHVPVFTSEAGLVARGAVAAYGADMYQWGYQSGVQAAHYLRVKASLAAGATAETSAASTSTGAATSAAASSSGAATSTAASSGAAATTSAGAATAASATSTSAGALDTTALHAAGIHWALVKVRKRVYNPAAAARFGLSLPAAFQPLR